MTTDITLEHLTQDILAELGESPELITALVSETGLVPTDLRRLAAGAPHDLSIALVDFICADDDRMTGFCARRGWAVDRLARIRAMLEATGRAG